MITCHIKVSFYGGVAIKKLGHARSQSLKRAQSSDAIIPAQGMQRMVESRNGQGPNPARPGALGINHFAIQSGVAQLSQPAFDVKVAAFGLQVLLGPDARLHSQRNRCTGGQCQTRSHHGRRRAINSGQCGTGAAHQLHKVNDKVNVLVKPLAGQVKPVAIVGVKNQVIAHTCSLVRPATFSINRLIAEVMAGAQVADKAVPEYARCLQPIQSLFLWASCKLDIESVETFNVAQARVPAPFLKNDAKGGAA